MGLNPILSVCMRRGQLFTPCSLKLTSPIYATTTDDIPGLPFPVSSVLSIYDTNEEILHNILGHPSRVLG